MADHENDSARPDTRHGLLNRRLLGKTYWAWIRRGIVPLIVVLLGIWFNVLQGQAIQQQHATDVQLAADQQQETELQTYLDRMSDLLLNPNVHQSGQAGDDVRILARARTLTVLRRLDGPRRAVVMKFLSSGGLIKRPDRSNAGVDPIVNLDGADFSGRPASAVDLKGMLLGGADLAEVDLSGVHLEGADLSGAFLSHVHLSGAHLQAATLRFAQLTEGADLRGADLTIADLTGADLIGANLQGANLTGANLDQADLRGADLTGAKVSTDQLLKAKTGPVPTPAPTSPPSATPTALPETTPSVQGTPSTGSTSSGGDGTSPPAASSSWVVTPDTGLIHIAYGSEGSYPEYTALHLSSGYFRVNYGPASGWGSSVILLPAFWSAAACPGGYCQGAPVSEHHEVSGADLVLVVTGNIGGLSVTSTVQLSPPTGNRLVVHVSTSVAGTVVLDSRPGEAFKPVMVASMHESTSIWDARSAYVGSSTVVFPGSGWITQPPVDATSFGLRGGTSSWKVNAPTIGIGLDRSMPVTGWVTASNDPNADNVGFWCATDTVLASWSYTITASAT